MPAPSWTEEAVAEVERHLEAGLGPKMIAELMDMTRGQVSGIICRRGLCGRKKRETRPGAKRRPVRVLGARKRRPSDAKARFRTCQYPFGDPRKSDYHLCGKPITPDGRPYCDDHQLLCTLPDQPRKEPRSWRMPL